MAMLWLRRRGGDEHRIRGQVFERWRLGPRRGAGAQYRCDAEKYRAHGAQGDRIRCAHSRHGVGTEASAVHKGAVARAAIRNEAGAAHIQSERTVALGHCQRGQIDLVLRVPTDPDGAAPSQECRWPPRQARLRNLARRRHATCRCTAGRRTERLAEPSANATLLVTIYLLTYVLTPGVLSTS